MGQKYIKVTGFLGIPKDMSVGVDSPILIAKARVHNDSLGEGIKIVVEAYDSLSNALLGRRVKKTYKTMGIVRIKNQVLVYNGKPYVEYEFGAFDNTMQYKIDVNGADVFVGEYEAVFVEKDIEELIPYTGNATGVRKRRDDWIYDLVMYKLNTWKDYQTLVTAQKLSFDLRTS